MKKFAQLFLVSVLFLSACSSSTKTQTRSLQVSEAVSSDEKIALYIQEVHRSILSKMFIENDFYGKECNVRIEISKYATVSDNLQAEGYQPLCNAGVAAIKNAVLPVPPDENTYQVFKKVVISFQPR